MIEIGFWRTTPNSTEDLPWPTEGYDPRWDTKEQLRVAAYLDSGQEHAAYKGTSMCRICGQSNGSRDLTDGTYLWPEGFSHYVRDHKVKPSQEFIDHALKNFKPEMLRFSGKKQEDEAIQALRAFVIPEPVESRLGIPALEPEPEPEVNAAPSDELKDLAKEIVNAGCEDEIVKTHPGLITIKSGSVKPQENGFIKIDTSGLEALDAGDIPPIAPKAKALQRALNAVENAERIKSEVKAKALEEAKNRGRGRGKPLVPNWDQLSFDQKAEAIRRLTRRR